MHPEALEGARAMIDAAGVDARADLLGLDLGGADINGTARSLLPMVRWVGLDAQAGPGVDIVADARTWTPDREYDVVLCTELLEHVQGWERCIGTAWRALREGGHLVVTCASTGRRPHGARGEFHPGPGEWYANVPPDALEDLLREAFAASHVRYRANPGDAYAWARK
ncbi:class I SAM-dependent methyltransferase [Saccharothrix xinjiangensis]|uniref:Class I SAM-dependent methyltransferase n=1 Tax=Saccharothrix xinjiangensis TaxID=204798 RepID=A0ABV9XWH4_9PSEU